MNGKNDNEHKNLLIHHAAQLVTCSGFSAKKGNDMSDLRIIEDGAVVIENGIISDLGKTNDILKKYKKDDFKTINARNRAVLPGFVDPHTHFLFSGDRSEEFTWRTRGMSYMEIMERGGGIAATVRATRAADSEALFGAGLMRLDTMLGFGVTTVEGKSGYGLDCDTEIRLLEVMKKLDESHPVDIVSTFLGAHVVPDEYKKSGDAYIDFIISTVLPVVAERRLAEFCDVFCEKGIFSIDQAKRLLHAARSMGLGLKLHADEIKPTGGAELAAELDAVSADHLLNASDNGIEALRDAGVVATLLPGTAFCLKEPYARARFMIDSGAPVALATDMNPGTFCSESLPLIVALAVLNMDMSIEEAVTAITINAAAALKRADRIGSIDVGKQADLVLLAYPSYTFLAYRTGISTIGLVIKGGTVVYDRMLVEPSYQRTGNSNHDNKTNC